MLVLTAFRLAAAAVTAMAIGGPLSVAVAAPASSPSVAGTWKGPLAGYSFTFEFKQTGNGWTGRSQSDKSDKWSDLQNISFTDGTVRFSFVSQPPSSFTLKIDEAGKALNGSVKFGPYPPLPLMLTRVS